MYFYSITTWRTVFSLLLFFLLVYRGGPEDRLLKMLCSNTSGFLSLWGWSLNWSLAQWNMPCSIRQNKSMGVSGLVFQHQHGSVRHWHKAPEAHPANFRQLSYLPRFKDLQCKLEVVKLEGWNMTWRFWNLLVCNTKPYFVLMVLGCLFLK